MANFATSFGITAVKKDYWPYTYYQNIAEIDDATDFPPITAFDKSPGPDPIEDFLWQYELLVDIDDRVTNFGGMLNYFGIPSDDFTELELSSTRAPESKIHVIVKHLKMPPFDYVECKENFEDKIKSGEWATMMDQLEYYNVLDTKLLAQAWMSYTELFYTEFGVDPQGFMSLSQLAQAILFSFYPKNSMPMFTFDEKLTWLNRDIRKNLYGGLSAVFCRHAQTDVDEKYPALTYQTPNGSRVKNIQQLDVNSLYSTVMKMDLPIGVGVLYENVDGNFLPQRLGINRGGNASKISLHWLNHMQGKFVENGRTVPIQCALNGQEKQIGDFFLDGYVFYQNQRIGLDFRFNIL